MKDTIILSKYISMISRLSSHYMNSTLKKYQINNTQFIILMDLYRHNNMVLDKICTGMYIDKAAVTRATKDLEEKGYIVRKVSNTDKRAKNIYLTDKAIAIKEKLAENGDNWNACLSKGINDEDLLKYKKQLELMFFNGKELIEKLNNDGEKRLDEQ